VNALQLIKRAVSGMMRKAAPTLSPVSDRGWFMLHDYKPGAWQADIQMSPESVLANWALYSCVSLIASDIGKLSVKLMQEDREIYREVDVPAFSPVLRKPNHFQTMQKFIESWVLSKLTRGNAYVLKVRDARGVVVALYVLDPTLVTPLVATNGAIYYQLQNDNLSGIFESMPAVPASEIIHDTGPTLFHPLVGVSPIFACGLAATQGLKIQQNSAKFFENMSRPSGMLTAPAQISDATALRLKTEWEKNFSGDNIGKVAVLGDGLTYEAMTVNPIDAELVAQLRMSAEMVCSTFHVPPFKIGAGAIPQGQKVEDLNQIYYSDCLQAHMEAIEALLEEGLGLDKRKDGVKYCVEFDLDDLLKMDSATMIDALNKSVSGGWMAPDEARARRNLPPVTGGATPYLQQQNYSLAALAKRDAQADPFKPAGAADPAPPQPDPAAEAMLEELEALRVKSMLDDARRAVQKALFSEHASAG